MTRTTKDCNLSTPAARARLKPRDKPFWHALDPGVRLGYRRHQLGAKWVWNRYKGAGRYSAETFAGADDFLKAAGVRVLDYGQAIAKVRERASAKPAGPVTVAEAMAAYFERLRQKGRRVDEAERRAEMHILPGLGDKPVDALTAPFSGRMARRARQQGQGRQGRPGGYPSPPGERESSPYDPQRRLRSSHF
jgi:hypothetical protein